MPDNDDNSFRMKAPETGVTVRMYNPGFGDCFLLAFRARDDKPRYMLIDCGVLSFYPDCSEKMKEVVEDIAKATDSRLHYVVVTHQHSDHLYGFRYGRDIFKCFEIDKLWLAWTENSTDESTKKLEKEYGKSGNALRIAVEELESIKHPLALALKELPDYESFELLAANRGNADQLEFLREKSKEKLVTKNDYRDPDEEPFELSEIENIKVYTLGPPRELKWYHREVIEDDLYIAPEAINEFTSFISAVHAYKGGEYYSSEDERMFKRSKPFEKEFEIPAKNADEHEFFSTYYGFDAKDEKKNWRRIDTDWLEAVMEIALDKNYRTNNSSLALAFELIHTKPSKILLFPGDAQTGSWLSWHEKKWQSDSPNGDPITIKNIFEKTVLYKVCHHGSVNATLKKKGLELMNNRNLVAMIPVDHEWATTKENPWDHPDQDLLDRLIEKTDGRILRSDKIPGIDETLEKPIGLSESKWNEYKSCVDWDKKNQLWIQYTVK